jgi:hypothetical protein
MVKIPLVIYAEAAIPKTLNIRHIQNKKGAADGGGY